MRTLAWGAAAALTLAGCGRDFHFADSASDLRAFDPEFTFVSIRGLPDGDIGELSRFRELKSIDFSGGWGVRPLKVTAVGFARLAELDLPRLSSLNLQHSPSVDDECLRHVGHLRGLTTVTLNESTGFTRTGLAQVLALPSLTYLDLRGCAQIDDSWADLLATGGSLTQLGVTATGLSPDGVARLRGALANCHVDDDPEYRHAVLDRAHSPGWGGPPERRGR